MSLRNFVAGFAVLAASVFAQSAPQQESQKPASTIRSTTQEVLLDMVFRDKKGRPIRDIKPEEIEITDDGSPQKLNSFRLIEGGEGKSAAPSAGAAPGASAGAIDPMREIRLVTLVFEGLDVEGKRFFRAATKDLLNMAPEQNLYFSVFTVDQKLHCLQPFTTDHTALQKGVDRAATWSFVQYNSRSAEIKETLAQIVNNPVVTQTNAGGPPTNIGASVAYQLAKLQYEMLQFADTTDREAGARGTLFSLLNLVRQQAKLPGRKTILYFNPWLNVPESLAELFQAVVSTANRSNVTFYTVDPKGLVTYSQGGTGRSEIAAAAGESRAQVMAGGVGPVSQGQAKVFDSLQSGIRANPQLWLKDLAESTGGFLIAETNDWKAPLRIVMDEVRTYYEAAYTPNIDVYDGKLRKIVVKVSRPDVVVHTRSGYYALPPVASGQQVYAFEMPLLNAINAMPPVRDVTFRSSAHQFDARGPNVEYMITVEVPMAQLTFQEQPEKKVAVGNASMLALVKNQQGEIVAKFSKEFPLSLAVDKLDAYKASNIIQTFHAELPPGRYQLATVVADRLSNKAGVKKASLVAPAATGKLVLSDLVMIRRVDQIKEGGMSDAFYYEGGKIVPTLSDTIKGGPGQMLPFYFAVYPDKAVAEPPQLTMAFFKDGASLGSAKADLGKPEANGRIPYIANIPADAFKPGSYEVKATIRQGPEAAEKSLLFNIE